MRAPPPEIDQRSPTQAQDGRLMLAAVDPRESPVEARALTPAAADNAIPQPRNPATPQPHPTTPQPNKPATLQPRNPPKPASARDGPGGLAPD